MIHFYSKLLLNARYILEEKQFSLRQASYLSLEYNLNDPEISLKLVNDNLNFYVYRQLGKMDNSKSSRQIFITIMCAIIGIIALGLVPVFYKARMKIIEIYFILKELYTYELKF